MRRLSCALLTTAAVTLLLVSTAQGGWYDRCRDGVKQFCANCKRDFHRNNCWPQAFVAPDRSHVQGPVSLMIVQGWQQQNLLGSHHFTPDSAQLTTAGQLKVREILTLSPPAYRMVLIERGPDGDVTVARINAVETWVSSHLPEGTVAYVRETHLVAEGRPADVVDAISVRFNESRPVPQLPPRTTEASL